MNSDWLYDLIKLKRENPGLDIIPMIDEKVVCDDTHSFWEGWVHKVEKGFYCIYRDNIYSDIDIDILMETIKNDYCSESEHELKERFNSISKKEVIYIWIGV